MDIKSVITMRPEPNAIKLFYGNNLQIFLIGYSVFPWQAFIAESDVGAYPIEAFFRVGSLYYSQILGSVGRKTL
jgi:hypothetical protein